MFQILRNLIIFLSLSSVIHAQTFKVNFQSSNEWSSKEMMKYKKDLPRVTNFTICHWEYLRYFSSSDNTIWSYCSIESKIVGNVFHCIGLYSSGIRDFANRKLKIGVWLEGWTKPAISDALDVTSYRPRTWNHICWSYSGVSFVNTLYLNGEKIGDFETFLPNRSMVQLPLHDSKSSIDSALIVGQDPDEMNGGFDSAEAFIGEISELNMWSPMLDIESIHSVASCSGFEKGNVVSWEKPLWEINVAVAVELKTKSIFCEETPQLIIFPKPTSVSQASYMCQIHGGGLVVPRSEKQNDEVKNLLSIHKNICMNQKQKQGANVNDGKAAWLGFERVGFEWFTMTDKVPVSKLNFSKLTQNGVQVEEGCGFMNNDGSWGTSFSKSWCNSIQLCFVCEVFGSPMFTLKGLCEKGTPFDWNYYMQINSSGQLDYFDGYKRIAKIENDNGKWFAETSGSRIQLSSRSTPIGRLDWEWFETACYSEIPQKRQLAFSRCSFRDEFTCNSGLCIPQADRCNGNKECEDGSDEDESCTLVIIPYSYKKNKPPTLEETINGTKVITNLKVVSIDKIDSINMHVGLTIDLGMTWYDPRLQFRNIHPGQSHLLNQETIQELWLPFQNLVFENAIIGKVLSSKHSQFQVSLKATNDSSISVIESMSPYRTLEDVWFEGQDHPLQATKRLKVEYFCNFYLLQFPFDTNICKLTLKMKSTKNLLVYFSQEKSSAAQKVDKDFREFHVVSISSTILKSSQTENNVTWQQINNSFVFSMEVKRDVKDLVISIFFPELLLWFLAYITIFLKINDISNRSRISVTILLVLVALIGNITDKIPPTPYFKYVDIWSIWYLSNIFLITCFHVFVEYSMDKDQMNPDLNVTQPWESMYDTKEKSNLTEEEMIRNRKKINYLASIIFPLSTMIFNVVYFLLSTV